jgi:glycoprotease/Kae1 family metallohydrolase
MGIESSAHTLGVGIADKGRILSSARRMYRITDKGLIPSRVADFHSEGLGKTIDEALRKAGLSISEIDAIGYTKGPGLGACLRVGQLGALLLGEKLSVPVIPVNHAIGHIEVTRTLSAMRDPLALYVSGGNSQILGIVAEPYRHYHVFGETFDIGIGNALDAFARRAKLNPAWGSSVEKAAEGGKYREMPYTVKGMDFTFSGILTHAERILGSVPLRDICYSMQETAFSMLCEATERALFVTKKRELLLCGGVAQNARLAQMAKKMAESHKIRFAVAPAELNADNGAMIAVVAEKMLRSKALPKRSECTVKQRYRVDSVRVGW